MSPTEANREVCPGLSEPQIQKQKTMSSRKSTSTAENRSDRKSESKQKDSKSADGRRKSNDGMRETIESIAIAFILAFLFKTFQAEAYVIPTGSMAPTLFGRHKEVTCEGCGYHFELGASGEIDQGSGRLKERIGQATCVNCGLTNDVLDAPVFNGDRILVNKQVPGFDRFDVVVFKNPEQAHVNYIKRLVGLPKEVVRLRKGDLWVRMPGSEVFEVQRKPPFVQKDIQLIVYDDRFPATPLIEAGWPERWEPCVSSTADGHTGHWLPAENGWTPDRVARSYECEATVSPSWLRYRHFRPTYSDWQQPVSSSPPARLIADFCSFNSNDNSSHNGRYWVGDLTINATVNITEVQDGGTMLLELVDGPRLVHCHIDLATGKAELRLTSSADSTQTQVMATAETPLSSTGEYEISYANVDDRICLFIDGDLVEFDREATFEDDTLPEPTDRDLCPVGIAFTNAAATVSDLVLERDLYYRNDVLPFDPDNGLWQSRDYDSTRREIGDESVYNLLENPEAWTRLYAENVALQLSKYGRYGEYKLGEDEFLMFGDNSPMSQDSRLFDYYTRPMSGVFSNRYAVRRQDLIGKALFIFWPHGIPFLNDGEGFAVRNHKPIDGFDTEADPLRASDYPSIRVPFYPDLTRMKKIR